jgi:hypothetical protein
MRKCWWMEVQRKAGTVHGEARGVPRDWPHAPRRRPPGDERPQWRIRFFCLALEERTRDHPGKDPLFLAGRHGIELCF